MCNGKNQQGFNIIELLVTVTILSLLISAALPAYDYVITRKRLKAGTEDLYNYLKVTRSESVKSQDSLFLSFNSGSPWCYGLDDGAACDCAAANNCQVDGIETVINSTNYQGLPMNMALTGFSGGAGNEYVEFEGIRGVASSPGTITLSLNGLSTTIAVNKMGLLTICSDDLASYTSCPP